MRSLLKPWDRTGCAALLASFVAGLYVAVFYTLNNLTMLRGGDILFIFGMMIVPLSTPRVDRLLADFEFGSDLGNLPTAFNKIYDSPPKLRRVSPSCHLVLLSG